jgi:hypothetical protein
VQPPYLTKLVPFLCHTSVQGKAHCFEKVNGKLVDRFVIEPVASAALEALSIGTSFSQRQLEAQPLAYTSPLGHSQRDFQPPTNSCLTRPLSHDVFSSLSAGMQTSFVTVYGASIADVYDCSTDKLPVRDSSHCSARFRATRV